MQTEITHQMSRGVSIRLLYSPRTLPFVPDDDELDRQQCPHCSRIVTIEDAGVSYCPGCKHLLFTDDNCQLLSPDVGSVACPGCGAYIMLDGDINPDLGEFFLRGIAADLFCTDCGNAVEWDDAVQTEFHFEYPILPKD